MGRGGGGGGEKVRGMPHTPGRSLSQLVQDEPGYSCQQFTTLGNSPCPGHTQVFAGAGPAHKEEKG